MRQQIVLLVVFVFGYSLILGGITTAKIVSTTVDPHSNDISDNVTSEHSSTTKYQETTSTTTANVTSSPINPTTAPPETPPDPQNNDTAGYNTTTSEGTPLNSTTGSPPSSSFLNTDPKAEKRVDDGQRFDIASFVGGIILAIGVVALGFFLFKVYQSRKGPRAEYNNI